ncbi:hypothetical protein GCM10027515_04250 [Schumannella luteola]|uniref:Uncharacterized protein n=1 Tax=Schumannella luteola TaxID=472059 RepID=A0A852YL25_9MICO|nr:hypothetical protein [Schumannella luteola]NYG98439.1 hypothetical protein [Schumannella luteola]TPX01328.1 hypothetical protein FJ656_28495 [Schumannella luteola]
MSDPNENPAPEPGETAERDEDDSTVASGPREEQNTEPNPPLPQLYGQDMQGHDAATAESGEDVARADREPGGS